jgi:ABC-2 type transport system permease protein
VRGAFILLSKELTELRRSPVLVLSMLSLPAAMVAVPLVLVAYLDRAAPPETLYWLREVYKIDLHGPGGLAGVLVAAVAKNWLPLFLVMPVFLPILMAAQSVGGERERRTLEPLLATPISTAEIVLGKSLAAVVPSLAVTWIAAALLCLGLDSIAAGRMGPPPMPDASWLFGCLLLSPLLALFGNALAVVVSSRVLDPRAAQNLAAMTVLPLLGLVVGQIAGRLSLGTRFYLWFALGTAACDLLLMLLAVKWFDREALLTRWR